MFKDLVLKNRSYRRFDQSAAVAAETLRELVELARLSPSGGNRQPLKFLLVNDPARCSVVFDCLAWAGYLKDWTGPVGGERPAAYIVILLDKRLSAVAGCDHGVAAQSIMLGAVERGLGGCIVGSIRREELAGAFYLPDHFEILLALALGRPVEKVVLETTGPDGDIKYWRDADSAHHVPKRPLEELILDLDNRAQV